MSARVAICLDANAGIPPLPGIRDRLPDVLPQLYNPSSGHALGRGSKALIHQARLHVQESLSGLIPSPERSTLIFTSGGTEGLQGVIRAAQLQDLPWISQDTEHKASLALRAETDQHTSASFPLDPLGRIDVGALPRFFAELRAQKTLSPERGFLASLLWVNNETGVIQHDMDTVCSVIREAGGIILADAAQAWGKVIDPQPVDCLMVSGHKIGGLSGTGAIALSDRGKKLVSTSPFFRGSQESGVRGGTENTLGIWALGEAARAQVWKNAQHLEDLRNTLESTLKSQLTQCFINGAGAKRTANTTNISFEGVPSKSISLVDQLDLRGFAVSAGSACSSGIREPSHVLRAMGVSPELALASLRISLPPDMDRSTLDRFCSELVAVVARSRGETRP